MSVLKEASIQKRVVEYARKKGAIAIKLSTMGAMGTSGWPDYLFLYNGEIVFIEFKRLGGKLTPRQRHRIDQLNSHSFFVSVCSNVENGMTVLNETFGWTT